jgi:hypothetical protein
MAMDSLINAVLLFAQESAEVGGRGENPDEGTGVITIVVIAAVILVVGLVLVQVFRRGRVRPESQVRRPDEEGQVGRVGEFRDN